MVIDCFPFFNELDLLEIRLNSLAPYVDKFVLCEMPITHSGKPKPLFFQENKDRFKDFNITHLIAPPKIHRNSWKVEHAQREHLVVGIEDADPEDIILLSDLDEIPDLTTYNKESEGAFKQKLYYYYVNCYTGTPNWRGTIAFKKKNMSRLNRIRNHRKGTPWVGHFGWHFSTLGTTEQIIYKLESFAHTEFSTDEYKNKIKENREKLIDPYNRVPSGWSGCPVSFTIEEPAGPEWLLKNKERYKHLWI